MYLHKVPLLQIYLFNPAVFFDQIWRKTQKGFCYLLCQDRVKENKSVFAQF